MRQYIKHLSFPFAIIVIVFLSCSVRSEGRERYGTGLTESGSDKPAYTIFTNPAQDCSTSMNISWATPPGIKWQIEVVDDETGNKYIYDYDESFFNDKGVRDSVTDKLYYYPYVYRCETFNNIKSKLANGADVVEKHIFDKHGYELFDLEPDKDYSYKIITYNDSTGEEEYSDTYRFHTAGAPEWKAAVIGDFHHYSPLWGRMESAMDMIDVIDSVSGGIDWVLSTGDQCAAGGLYNSWTELSEQPNYKNYMWASVQGNHDNMTLDSKERNDNFFRDSHYFPYNGYEGQEGTSYWFKYGDVLFIMLNNEELRFKGKFEPAVQWMEQVVKDIPSKYVVVVEHHQWIIGQDGTKSQLERFHQIFDRLGVDLAISGHNHVYLRTYPLRAKQPVTPEEGTYYVVNSSSDNSRGRDMKPLKDNAGLIEKRWSEGSNTMGGMLMDVSPERIVMTLYDRYGTPQDSFTVPAKDKSRILELVAQP